MRKILLAISLFIGVLSVSGPAFAAATCPTNTNPVSGVCVPTASSTGLSDKNIADIIITTMNWLLGILGVIAMLMFVVSGFQYLAAGGDESKTEDAKGNVKYALIGVAVALAGYTIINTIDKIMKGTTTGI